LDAVKKQNGSSHFKTSDAMRDARWLLRLFIFPALSMPQYKMMTSTSKPNQIKPTRNGCAGGKSEGGVTYF